ncbi:MAG: hypothetical protein JJ911_09290 [Rhizobiaceae bacterium]|uniref:hypothetical protein n=1 Tax=Parvibaculum sp. TaxID=2024848 RepID=UPI001B0559EB|nr:hypothetical protein [Parvibaculum sp.]MBO6633371.1 hypothetical protein [Parvibaculum sp.]MBO6725840.1 hypothetical protein [Rhizobiaceae bacterium]
MVARILTIALAIAAAWSAFFIFDFAQAKLWIRDVDLRPVYLLLAAFALLAALPFLSGVALRTAKGASLLLILATASDLVIQYGDGIVENYSSTEYEGVPRDSSSVFLNSLFGKTLVSGGGEEALQYYRMLTVRSFVNGLSDQPVVDGLQIGIPMLMDDAKFAALSEHPGYPVWIGGYYHDLYVKPAGDMSRRYYFMLPPGGFDNNVIVISEELYEEL